MPMLKTLLPPCPSFSALSSCDDGDFLLFDNFPGIFSSTSFLQGRAPVIGSGTWNVFGEVAPHRAVSGDGNLTLSADNGNAYCEFALGEIPGEIGCTFEYVGSLSANQSSPTLACYPVSAGYEQNNFHFQASPTILNWAYWLNGVAANLPAWRILNFYALSPNTFYTYRVFLDPPYAQGFLFDPTGTLIGYITINEPNMANVIGKYVFFQLFDTK